MRFWNKFLLMSVIGLSSTCGYAATTRLPVCLNYPATGDTIANQQPCTGVVPVDGNGNPLNWQTLFSSSGSGGSGGNSAAGTVGNGAISSASQTGYVGLDGNLHNWVGDNNGHPLISIFGTSSVSVTGALPAGTNAIGSITNTSFGATQSGTWNVGVTGSVAVTGSFYQATQPVSIASVVGTNVSQINGTTTTTGTGTANAGTQRVAVSSDSFPTSQAVTNAGTFAVQNTAPLPAGTNTIGTVDTVNKAVTVNRSAVVGFSGTANAATSASTSLTVNTTSNYTSQAGTLSGIPMVGQILVGSGVSTGTTVIAVSAVTATQYTLTLSVAATVSSGATITSVGPQILMVANSSRRGFSIQNQGTGTCYINTTGTSTAGPDSLFVAAGSYYETKDSQTPTGAVSEICSSPSTGTFSREW